MGTRTAMIAMGGNSLSPKGEAGTITQQFAHTRETLDGIGYFIERGYNLCINHGNGPMIKCRLFLWVFVLRERKVPSAI